MKTLGPYELIQKLGTGATAEVFLARGPHPQGTPFLAVKVVHAHLVEDPRQREALMREARMLAGLSHEHLAALYEAGELEGRPYLAMELVRGPSLSALLKRLKAKDERLTPGEACAAVLDAARGLHHAHEALDAAGAPRGLVHRDISPHNLILDERGRVKVVDFGLAQVTSHATRGAGLKGKLAYMAPEQLEGKRLDRRADVFALGAVLFELASGTRLRPGTSEAELFQQALYLPLPRLGELNPGLSRALVELVEEAIARDVSQRLPSAEALARRLEAITPRGARHGLAERVADHFPPLPAETSDRPEAPSPAANEEKTTWTAEVAAKSDRRADAGPRSEGLGSGPDTVLSPARGFGVPAAEARTPPSRGLEVDRPRPRHAGALPSSSPEDGAGPAIQRADASALPEEGHSPERLEDPADLPASDEPTTMRRPGGALEAAALLRSQPAARPPIALRRLVGSLMMAGIFLAAGWMLFKRRPALQRPLPSLETASPARRAPGPGPEAPPRKGSPHRREGRGKGTLVLRSSVAAFVSERGAELGMTPLSLELPAGRYSLLLKSASGAATARVEVVVPSGGTVTQEVLLP